MQREHRASHADGAAVTGEPGTSSRSTCASGARANAQGQTRTTCPLAAPPTRDGVTLHKGFGGVPELVKWVGWRAGRVIVNCSPKLKKEYNELLRRRLLEMEGMAPFEYSAMVQLTQSTGEDWCYDVQKLCPHGPERGRGILLVPKKDTLKEWARGAICGSSDMYCLGGATSVAWYWMGGWSPWRSGKVRWMNATKPENASFYKIGEGDEDGNSDEDGEVLRYYDIERMISSKRLCHISHANVATWAKVIEAWEWVVWDRCGEYIRNTNGNPKEQFWMWETAKQIEEERTLWF